MSYINQHYSEIYLSSDVRSYGDSNQPSFILDGAINNAKKIKYIKSSIPKTYYSIISGINTFRFQEEIGAAFSASVPAGNYTIASFIVALQTALNTASTNGRTYTITHSSETNRFTVSINAGTFAILGASTLSTGHLFLGFPAVDTAQASSHIASLSERVTTYPENLYIRGTFGTSGYASQVDNQSTSNNVFTTIYTNGTDRNGVILDVNHETTEDYFSSENLFDNIQIYCTYKDINTLQDKIVDFNGSPFQVSVGLYSVV